MSGFNELLVEKIFGTETIGNDVAISDFRLLTG
jgi:hypothetical protein